MQHCQNRSDRLSHKETTPPQACVPREETATYPVPPMPPQACRHSRSNGKREASRKLSLQGLQEAHSGRRFQGNSGSLPWYRLAPDLALEQLDRRSLDEKAPLEHIALEGETTKLREVPPPTPAQLDRDKLELENNS